MRKESSSRSAFFNLRASIALLVCGVAAYSMLSGALLAFFRSEAPSNNSQRTLSFTERVAYQRAIEEVYWRQRIWPKERPDPKPSLDAVMSQTQLEKKVAAYLRESEALEDYWLRPMTPEQIQAEMDRMAQHTKQPEVLRELFEALGNDPFVIAECLARSVLTERLSADLSTQDKGRRFESARTKKVRGMSMATTLGDVAYTLPKISGGDPPCADDTWTATTITNAPTRRLSHTAVWTGSEMIIWGGFDHSDYFDTGGRYNPSTDSWAATSTINAPAGRIDHTAVWTGTEMIVWGGNNFSSYFNTGGRYNPSTDGWTATSTTNAPSPRASHTAVWTGSEMIVWGGTNDIDYFDTGGRYNPSTDSWTATSTGINLPDPRASHTAVWTGSEMIVWGASSNSTGGRYNPNTDSWTPTSTTNAPSARELHTAVWTGSQMIIWGGIGPSNVLNTGGRYNPILDGWTATSVTKAPNPRHSHTAVWTGAEMIIWGGYNGSSYFNTGGRYNPGMDAWMITSTSSAPAPRAAHTGLWSGSEMIVWGGVGTGNTYFNTGGRYCAQGGPSPTPSPTASPTPTPTPTASPTPTPTPTAPTATPTATGTPTPVPGLSPWTFVARYNYPINAPAVTSDGTFVYSAGGFYNGATRRFARYDPAANSWTRLPDVLVAFYAARAVYAASTNSIYVFGGYDGTASVITQIYNIGTETWRYGAAMPAGRYFSNLAYCSANGKIYVIGGFDGNDVQQSQTWEYDPVADTWNTSRTPIPMPMGGSGTGIVGNYIYLVGAWPASTTNYRYDIAADSWSQMAPSPVYIYEPAAATIGTNIYMIGGGNPYSENGKLSPHSALTGPEDSYNTTFIYDTQSNTWTTGPNLNLTRAFAAGTAIGTQLLVVGGSTNFGNTDTVETAFAGGGRVVCQYTITSGTDAIVPGTDDTGNHCYDCDTLVSLPFPFQLYDQTYTSVNVSSNGRLDFVCDNGPLGWVTQCLPPPANVCQYDFTIFALWGRVSTLTDASGCSTWANGCGIFTSVSGIAPNRIFNIEWHTTLQQDAAQTQTFEVRVYENDPNKRFDMIYGIIDAPQSAGAWVDGVQGDLGAGQITRDFCPCCSGYPCTSCGWTPPQNESRIYTLAPCGTPTPSPTPTATPTVTPTSTPRPTPTPRSTPPARPRPTPAPRP